MPDVIYAVEYAEDEHGSWYANRIYAPGNPYYSRAAVERAVRKFAEEARADWWNAENECDALRRDNDILRRALDEAPHATWCLHEAPGYMTCTCYKARLPRAGGEL